jgi:hypothetical protein
MAFFAKRKKFGDIAVEKGLIARWQLEQALIEQTGSRARGSVHKKIGSILSKKDSLNWMTSIASSKNRVRAASGHRWAPSSA